MISLGLRRKSDAVTKAGSSRGAAWIELLGEQLHLAGFHGVDSADNFEVTAFF